MEHYVTLFDSLFLPQGVALHASLLRHAQPFTLWVLCVDETTQDVLDRLQLANIRTIGLAEIETEELLAVKGGRSRGEYCWTLTPFSPQLVFDREPSAMRVTYLDADTWFCRSPAEIFEDFDASGKAVLITEHAYAPEYDQTPQTGRFCVQFMTFKRDEGEVVRRWWAERCIEWCFARIENGRFGDQMYLDDWPVRFRDLVHVLRKPSLTQAPWNVTRFAPSEAAFFHFHGLRLLRNRSLLLADSYYPLPATTRRMIYLPYLQDFRDAVQRLQAAGHAARVQIDRAVPLLRMDMALRSLRTWFYKARLLRHASL